MATDPFDALHRPDEPVRPATAFTRDLRARLADALGLGEPETTDTPLVDLPPRRSLMPTGTGTPATADPTAAPAAATALTPYLAVHDAAAALTFYAEAFGATEVVRMVGDDGRIGHAELALGPTRLYLADEYPEIGVNAPRTIGGTSFSIHLEVADVDDAHARAVAAGATSQREPADQPHGARSATVLDPFGHRWLLSQPLAPLTPGQLAERMAGAGYRVATPAAGQIWAGIVSHDAPALIRFLVEVFGFEAQLVVEDQPGIVEHSQIRWPEGGIVMVSTAERGDNRFSRRPVGQENLYVVTPDPGRVLERCRAAGLALVQEPSSPDYDPAGMSFTVADPDGNLWTFGTYAGEPGA